jgi:hypothetical protein
VTSFIDLQLHYKSFSIYCKYLLIIPEKIYSPAVATGELKEIDIHGVTYE